MKKNSRVTVAIHSLIHLVYVEKALTSDELGECQQTNPVVVRRILGDLKKADIVSSEKGHGGGWVLTKKPEDISFQDIFTALQESLLPSPITLDENEHCLVMKLMAGTMDEFLEDAQILLAKKLAKLRLSDITSKIM